MSLRPGSPGTSLRGNRFFGKNGQPVFLHLRDAALDLEDFVLSAGQIEPERSGAEFDEEGVRSVRMPISPSCAGMIAWVTDSSAA